MPYIYIVQYPLDNTYSIFALTRKVYDECESTSSMFV